MSDVTSSPCRNCGANVPAGAGFCPTCGTAATVVGTYGGPPAPVNPQDSRNWALGAHLGALAGGFVGGIGSWVAPLIVWLSRRETDPFAAEHAREALNFNLTMVILVLGGFLISILTLGVALLIVIPAGLVIGVLWLIWSIQGAIAASQGSPYRYPLSIRMING